METTHYLVLYLDSLSLIKQVDLVEIEEHDENYLHDLHEFDELEEYMVEVEVEVELIWMKR